MEVARNHALVEKLWSLQMLGSGGWSKQAGHWGAEGKAGLIMSKHISCACGVPHAMGWMEVGLKDVQCSSVDGCLRASCLKWLIALPIARWVL